LAKPSRTPSRRGGDEIGPFREGFLEMAKMPRLRHGRSGVSLRSRPALPSRLAHGRDAQEMSELWFRRADVEICGRPPTGDDVVSMRAAERFMGLFRGRVDAWGALHGECMHERVGAGNYARHLGGRTSLGIYPLLNNGACGWAAIDLDRDDLRGAVRLFEALRDLGMNAGLYIERSKSKGFHVWMLFDSPVGARDVRRLCRAALRQAGLAAEIFPKQDALDGETRLGNYVHLPYFGGDNRDGRRMVIDPATLRPLPLAVFLDSVTTFPRDMLPLILAELPPEAEMNGHNLPGWFSALLASRIEVGQRRPTLTRIAGYLRSHGIEEAGAVELAICWAREHFDVPLDEAEIGRHIRGPFQRYGIRNAEPARTGEGEFLRKVRR